MIDAQGNAQGDAQGPPQFEVHLTSGADSSGREERLAVLRRFGIAFAYCLLSAAPSFAQSLSPPSAPQAPLRGFVPPYEILRTVRAAGFEPLAPPLRERTTYVVRAIDFRGVAMRVVVDARSGAIRDANRIVSGPGLYGPYVPGPYAPASYGRLVAPPYPPDDIEAGYGRPPHSGASELAPNDRHIPGLGVVPLPRARPTGLAATGGEKKPVVRPDVATSAASQSEPSAKPGRAPAVPAIND